MDFSHDDYLAANAWPFEEARRVIAHLEKTGKPADEPVIFETGFGASGLPHIGTFGENFRTTMVLQAFTRLSKRPCKLIVFSDDLDALRKVPTNLPQQDMLRENLGKPISAIPDPFGEHSTFAAQNNARLIAFLDKFNFEYTFISSTEAYTSGRFNNALLEVLKHHEAIRNIVVPTLGKERQQSYSPFLPICAETGRVLQVPVIATDVAAGTLTYLRDDGKEVETPVTDGHCKLQWKADWAMRWYALGVDYEMSGKDLIDSVTIGNKICRQLGGTPPVALTYEHFVDENGAKISKSKGNGVSIDEWLKYANTASLGLFMYRQPKRAKKLFLQMIPKEVDDWDQCITKYHNEDKAAQLENAAWHIHNGNVPQPLPISYNMLLNLLGAVATEATPELLWGMIQKYQPAITPEAYPQLNELIVSAVHFYQDIVQPSKQYRAPTAEEINALKATVAMLQNLTGEESAEDIQTAFYTLGKEFYGKENLRSWFKMLYEVLFGTSQGPRLGSFVYIFGKDETVALINSACTRKAA